MPDAVSGQTTFSPDPGARYNVLVMHGEIEGVIPAAADRSTAVIPAGDLGVDRWSYVALGHYHVHRLIARNAYYSGSIEYTSLNTWGELVEARAAGLPGKGFIEYDLDTGSHRFHTLPSPRPHVDMTALSARGLTATEVDARIRDAVSHAKGGIDGKIVRQRVRDIPRHIVRDLDHKALREYQRRALHFQLDASPPEMIRHRTQVGGAPGRRPTLADIVRDKLHERVLEADIDRSTLVDLGLRYLVDAEAAARGRCRAPMVRGWTGEAQQPSPREFPAARR